VAEPVVPDALSFIRDCSRGSDSLDIPPTCLGQRFIARETIIQAVDTYEIVEAYPGDKYFRSYLVLGRKGDDAVHVLFGVDVEGQNVRIVTAYYPSLDEWEIDLKTRRRSS
jgi:hypothetical protein